MIARIQTVAYDAQAPDGGVCGERGVETAVAPAAHGRKTAFQAAGGGHGGADLVAAVKLTVPQAAKAMGIGQTKMREIVRRGDVPVLRIMGKMLILERDLEAYLEGSYGPLTRTARMPPKGLPPLPRHVQESGLMKKAS